MRLLSAACLSCLFVVPVQAGPAGDALRDALYAGTLDEGIAKLQPLAAADDSEASFGLGMIGLVQTAEKLAQSIYRHGFTIDTGMRAFDMLMPPLPLNPSPEPLDYEGVRAILGDLVTGLDEAHGWFVAGGATGDWVVEIDPLKVRLDFNGDGKSDEAESLASLMALMFPEENAAPPSADAELVETIVGFDRADSYWFAGYTQVVSAQADFLLAHDFSMFANATFHRLFPKAGFPMQDYATGGQLMFDPDTDTALADVVALIHTINWPVKDAAKLKGVRDRLASVLDLSRQNWAAIFDETDNNRELVPSPRQTGIDPGITVTQQQVDAWMATLDQAERVLNGELLIPHWRFKQGINLKAYFESATHTDLIMLITGYDAVPYLKEGPVASAGDFRAAQDAFGSDWLGYAFWFN